MDCCLLSSLEVAVNEPACNVILETVNQKTDLPEMSKAVSRATKMRKNCRAAQERKRRNDIANLITQLQQFLPDEGRSCKQRAGLVDKRDVLREVLKMLQDMQKK